MGEVVFALDPGQTTGWAIIRKPDKLLLGMGDLSAADLGCGIDLLVRSMHRLDYGVSPVVERMPTPPGAGGKLATDLEFVRRTVDHWLLDVFELDVSYVLPGVWKPSRAAIVTLPPKLWNGLGLSQHMRDAFGMGMYYYGAKKR